MLSWKLMRGDPMIRRMVLGAALAGLCLPAFSSEADEFENWECPNDFSVEWAFQVEDGSTIVRLASQEPFGYENVFMYVPGTGLYQIHETGTSTNSTTDSDGTVYHRLGVSFQTGYRNHQGRFEYRREPSPRARLSCPGAVDAEARMLSGSAREDLSRRIRQDCGEESFDARLHLPERRIHGIYRTDGGRELVVDYLDGPNHHPGGTWRVREIRAGELHGLEVEESHSGHGLDIRFADGTRIQSDHFGPLVLESPDGRRSELSLLPELRNARASERHRAAERYLAGNRGVFKRDYLPHPPMPGPCTVTEVIRAFMEGGSESAAPPPPEERDRARRRIIRERESATADPRTASPDDETSEGTTATP